jgi:hypothetical protein
MASLPVSATARTPTMKIGLNRRSRVHNGYCCSIHPLSPDDAAATTATFRPASFSAHRVAIVTATHDARPTMMVLSASVKVRRLFPFSERSGSRTLSTKYREYR